MAYATTNIFARLSQDPSVILDEINKLLYNCLEGQLCMTFFAAILDSNTDKLIYANGGHCFPLLIPKDPEDSRIQKRTPSYLPMIPLTNPDNSESSVLGMHGSAQFKNKEIDLKKFDRIVFYTDGLTEAKDKKNKMWGNRRMYKSITRHNPKSIDLMVDGIITDLEDFHQQDAYEDDVTLVIVEYC